MMIIDDTWMCMKIGYTVIPPNHDSSYVWTILEPLDLEGTLFSEPVWNLRSAMWAGGNASLVASTSIAEAAGLKCVRKYRDSRDSRHFSGDSGSAAKNISS